MSGHDLKFMGEQPERIDRERVYDGTSETDVQRLTGAVREADHAFESTGGSSRHWVTECLLPHLEIARLAVVDARDLQHLKSAERDVNSLAEKLDTSDRIANDLLSALTEMVEKGEGCAACGTEGKVGCGCRYERARAAIAKARGGA